jgi:hypothetical protein
VGAQGPLLAARADDPVLEAVRPALLDRRQDLAAHLIAQPWMDVSQVGIERRREPRGLDAEDPVELIGPDDLVLLDAPLPAPEIGDSLGLVHQRRGCPELLRGAMRERDSVLWGGLAFLPAWRSKKGRLQPPLPTSARTTR